MRVPSTLLPEVTKAKTNAVQPKTTSSQRTIRGRSAPGSQPTGGRFGELLGYEVSDRPIFHLIPQGARTGGQGLDGNDAVKQVPIRRYGLHPTTRRLAESGQSLAA